MIQYYFSRESIFEGQISRPLLATKFGRKNEAKLKGRLEDAQSALDALKGNPSEDKKYNKQVANAEKDVAKAQKSLDNNKIGKRGGFWKGTVDQILGVTGATVANAISGGDPTAAGYGYLAGTLGGNIIHGAKQLAGKAKVASLKKEDKKRRGHTRSEWAHEKLLSSKDYDTIKKLNIDHPNSLNAKQIEKNRAKQEKLIDKYYPKAGKRGRDYDAILSKINPPKTKEQPVYAGQPNSNRNFSNLKKVVITPPKKSVLPGTFVGAGVGAGLATLGAKPLIEGVKLADGFRKDVNNYNTYVSDFLQGKFPKDFTIVKPDVNFKDYGPYLESLPLDTNRITVNAKIPESLADLQALSLPEGAVANVFKYNIAQGLKDSALPMLGGAALGMGAGLATNALVDRYRQNKYLRQKINNMR